MKSLAEVAANGIGASFFPPFLPLICFSMALTFFEMDALLTHFM